VRSYDVKLRLSTERQSMDAVQTRLARVRQVAERAGFHISELEIRGEDGDRRQLVEEAARG
jgi:hypothetical protein